MYVQIRAKNAEHEEEIMQIKQKVGQDQRFSIFHKLLFSICYFLHVVETREQRKNT